MRGLSNQYFFKSQESLATVIDTVSDNDEDDGDTLNKNTDNTNQSKDNENEKSSLESEEKEEILGKTTTV